MRELQDKREEIIRFIASSEYPSMTARNLADDLYSLDLTVYSLDYTFDSIVYNSLASSEIDSNISLHPEQLRIISEIQKNEALIISAPTSFGKTFCVFEYIVRNRPQNIVLIVPTLALVDEYLKKLIKRYRSSFSNYKIHTNIIEDKEYDFSKQNIFILTHDKVVQEALFVKITSIDFLVIDEVYKLETDENDDRVLVLNMAYYYLSRLAKKYVLLAPFINTVIDNYKLEKQPIFYKSDYSPVVNEIVIRSIITNEDRFAECEKIVKETCGEKTLIYFAVVTGKFGMYKYIENVISLEEKITDMPIAISSFIEWAKEEIHEDWCVVTALERGYLVHNGQIPVGIRIFQLDQYDNSEKFNKMLCTSTLLEGVNTSAENIIIVQPNRKYGAAGNCFSAFDFFNLVGRTGRLNEHLIGKAYYIKGPNDVEFNKDDAIKDIRFEILDNTDDMDIQLNRIEQNQSVLEFFNRLGIDLEAYKNNVGSKVRFSTAVKLYESYKYNQQELEEILRKMASNPMLGRYYLVNVLLKIIYGKEKKLDASITNELLRKSRPTIRSVVESVRRYFESTSVNILISKAIKIKNGLMEHEFYKKTGLIMYFCELDKIGSTYLNIIRERILTPIEYLYFINAKNKKILLDMGIYERDIEKIIKIIGDDYDDVIELKNRLVAAKESFKSISFLSRYVINSLS